MTARPADLVRTLRIGRARSSRGRPNIDRSAEAIEVEQAGLEVGPAPEPEFCDELVTRLDRDEAFRTAFEALTPGRRREYHLHFSSAKQSSTRAARVEKYAPKILDGKGFRDR